MTGREPEVMQSDGRASRRVLRRLSGHLDRIDRLGHVTRQAQRSFAVQACIAIMKRECAAGVGHKAGSEPDSCGACTQTRAILRVIRQLAGMKP
jgi:hypothetical protein